jgi:two-component sensor histidine kinase
MALVHENLYQSKNYAKVNFREYIESLMMNLFQVYGVKGDRMTLEQEIDIVALNIDTAIPCGLIINELVSNALNTLFPTKNRVQSLSFLRLTKLNTIPLLLEIMG